MVYTHTHIHTHTQHELLLCHKKRMMLFIVTWMDLLLFSLSVEPYSLWPHGLQYLRLPCRSLSPGVYSNSSSRWCYPTISSSVTLFSCPQSFLASGSFPVGQPFASGGQSIGVSASASVLPMNIQGWFSFRIDWFDLAIKGLSWVFSSTKVQKETIFQYSKVL